MQVNQFRVPGMANAHDVRAMTVALQAISGVERVQVDMTTRSVRVVHQEIVNTAMLIATLQRAGYTEVHVLV